MNKETRDFLIFACGFAIGALLIGGCGAEAVGACGVSGFGTDSFVRWAEERQQWHPGQVKMDWTTSPPYEAMLCGTKILPDNVYAVYVKRLSP